MFLGELTIKMLGSDPAVPSESLLFQFSRRPLAGKCIGGEGEGCRSICVIGSILDNSRSCHHCGIYVPEVMELVAHKVSS